MAGDFFSEVPQGGDVYVVSNILHDWDDAQSARILSTCRRAMEPGARLLIVEVVLPEQKPHFDLVILDLEMMVLTGGRERTEAEFAALLSQTGFRPVRTLPTTSPLCEHRGGGRGLGRRRDRRRVELAQRRLERAAAAVVKPVDRALGLAERLGDLAR